MFENFQKFIPKAANHYGIARQMEASHICELFRKLIPEIFPKATTSQISPAYFKDSVLTVHVASSAWAQEITMKKSQIIKQINEKIQAIPNNNQTKLNEIRTLVNPEISLEC